MFKINSDFLYLCLYMLLVMGNGFLYLCLHFCSLWAKTIQCTVNETCFSSDFITQECFSCSQQVEVFQESFNTLPSSLKGFPSSTTVKNLPAMQEMWVLSSGQEDSLKKEMETHSSILA